MFGSNLHIKKFTTFFLTFFLAGVFIPLQSLAQNREVVAEKGEGIYRLLTRNGLDVSSSLKSFIELNKENLGKDNSLLAGVTYKLPVTEEETYSETPATGTASTMHFDIFGKKYADVEIVSTQLKGAVYYLMAGHGGPDPGAVAKYNNQLLCEDEYAYDVTIRLARNLISNGASVYMITRDPNDGIRDESYLKADKDEICYFDQVIPLNQLKRLRQRTDAVNSLYQKNKGTFQRMVAIHVDSRSRGEHIDVFFYHDKRSETGEKATRILQKTFQDKYDIHQPGRGYHGTVSTRNLYVVKNTYPVAIYIELGNINHLRDQKRFIVTNNRQAVANWLTEGLITDFKTNK